MTKFCKIIENEAGEQLLLRLGPSDEGDGADIIFVFKIDGAIAEITFGGIDWDKAEEMLDKYAKEDGMKILDDPMRFLKVTAGI